MPGRGHHRSQQDSAGPGRAPRTRGLPGAREDLGRQVPPNPHIPSLSPPRSLLPNNGVGRTAPILQAKSPEATRVVRMESWEAAGKQGPLPIPGGATSPHRRPGSTLTGKHWKITGDDLAEITGPSASRALSSCSVPWPWASLTTRELQRGSHRGVTFAPWSRVLSPLRAQTLRLAQHPWHLGLGLLLICLDISAPSLQRNSPHLLKSRRPVFQFSLNQPIPSVTVF